MEDRIKIFCEGRKIGFTFDSLITDDVVGKKFAVELKGVRDLAGNGQDKTAYLFESVNANLNLVDASASFQVELDNSCTNPISAASTDLAKAQVSKTLGGADVTSRLQIESIVCDDARGLLTVDFKVSSSAGRRGLRATDRDASGGQDNVAMTSFHVASNLARHLTVRNLKIEPGAEDAEKKKASEGQNNSSSISLDDGSIRTSSDQDPGDMTTLLLQQFQSLQQQMQHFQAHQQQMQQQIQSVVASLNK